MGKSKSKSWLVISLRHLAKHFVVNIKSLNDSLKATAGQGGTEKPPFALGKFSLSQLLSVSVP